MFQTVSPIGFSHTPSSAKAKTSSVGQLEPPEQNSSPSNPFTNDTNKLKPSSDKIILAHTVPLSHTPHFGGEKEDKALWDAASDPNKLEQAKAIVFGVKCFISPAQSICFRQYKSREWGVR